MVAISGQFCSGPLDIESAAAEADDTCDDNLRLVARPERLGGVVGVTGLIVAPTGRPGRSYECWVQQFVLQGMKGLVGGEY